MHQNQEEGWPDPTSDIPSCNHFYSRPTNRRYLLAWAPPDWNFNVLISNYLERERDDDFHSDQFFLTEQKGQNWIWTLWLLSQRNHSWHLAAGDIGKCLSTKEKCILGASVLSKTRLLMSYALGQHVTHCQHRRLQKCSPTSFLLLKWSGISESFLENIKLYLHRRPNVPQLHRIFLSSSTIKPQ